MAVFRSICFVLLIGHVPMLFAKNWNCDPNSPRIRAAIVEMQRCGASGKFIDSYKKLCTAGTIDEFMWHSAVLERETRGNSCLQRLNIKLNKRR